MDEHAYESGEGGRKSLRVFVVNPAFEDPWRTQGDYRKEQEESRERHAMLQEQHRLLAKSLRWNIVLAAATVGIAIATVALVYVTIDEKQAAKLPRQEQQATPQEAPIRSHTQK